MKKPLTVAAWSAFWGIVLALISMLTGLGEGGSFILGLNIVITIVGAVLGFLFLYGFVVLGKKFDVALLVVMAWIGIAITVGFSILVLILNASIIASAQEAAISASQDISEGVSALILFLVLWVPISLFFGAYSILFGVGLLKLKDKVEYAKTAAILDIVGGATLVIFIGAAISLVSYFFKIAVMFKAARKYEGKR